MPTRETNCSNLRNVSGTYSIFLLQRRWFSASECDDRCVSCTILCWIEPWIDGRHNRASRWNACVIAVFLSLQKVNECYTTSNCQTIVPPHGSLFIASVKAPEKVALKLIRERKLFISISSVRIHRVSTQLQTHVA